MLQVPRNPQDFLDWSWEQLEPYYYDLKHRPLDGGRVEEWLADWTRINDLVEEISSRLYVATTQNTADEEVERRYTTFLEKVYPHVEEADQRLKERMLAGGLEPAGFELPLLKMRTEAEIFCQENLPLFAEEKKLGLQFNKVIGAQTVEWEGKEVTPSQLQPVFQEPDRALRETAWRRVAERQLADREAINGLWQQMLDLRRRLAANAGFADYRAYRWKQRLRFDYTPEDCKTFHRAIEEAIVPLARRILEEYRQALGVERLRPWDLIALNPPRLGPDPLGRPPLRPFEDVAELEEKAEQIFRQVSPQLGEYFGLMRREGLLDLPNRMNKAPGAYCSTFPFSKRPFIFANAVGLHANVQTLLHESGHAFHAFAKVDLPYHQQRQVGAEFNEVASMAMELLAAPYLEAEKGGFYSPQDARRARIEHLQDNILFWPYMAVVDAFQHWVYENPDQAMDPANCDAQWTALWHRFIPAIDWSGLEEVLATGWHRKRHIFRYPFYYVEYGMAQLGAVQIWGRALENQAQAIADYWQALSLGGTVPLPELYRTAGADWAFDTATVRQTTALIERFLEENGEAAR